ncbi:MAG: sigma-54 dependent transcriptional regulator [Burkholderiales bacterium]|nr:sigma-54 dependent transcriptional regulator [Burkholderiales bacterium]
MPVKNTRGGNAIRLSYVLVIVLMIRLNLSFVGEPLAQAEKMQSVIVCVKNANAQLSLQSAAVIMGVECSVMSLEQLLSKRSLVADWIVTEGSIEELVRLASFLTRAGVNPRRTVIRLIDQVWQNYVYHDLPIYASLVLPENSEQAADILTRISTASQWARERLRLDFDSVKADTLQREIELGESPAMLSALDMAARVAPLPVDILIQGETGTGKDTFARWIHEMSKRKGQFVHINCAALPEQLIESELFGVEAGAFTGALKSRIGKLEYAHEGTLYLDEIDSMPVISQAKLLRALQDRGAERLGGHRFIQCEFRVIASTKLELNEQVELGRFRQDLLFRLNVVNLFLPPLRQRSEDIPALFQYFCQQAVLRFKVEMPKIESNTISKLLKMRWPGNVRELKAQAERFVIGVETSTSVEGTDEDSSLKEALRRYEKQLIESALKQNASSVKVAAEALKTSPHALYYRMKQLGIKVREDAPAEPFTALDP